LIEEANIFYEHQSITSEKLRRAVENIPELQKYFKADFNGIKARHYCGIVSVEGEDFYILPKVAQDKEMDLEIFMRMLLVAYGMEVEKADTAASGAQKHRLFQALIDLFARTLLRQLQMGLYREYVTMNDRLRALRGRYLVAENALRSFDRTAIACEYDEFSADNSVNRFLFFAVRYLIPFADNAKNLRLIEAVFEETAYRRHDVGRLPEFHYSRLNERFRESVEMARWLLRHLMPIFAAGKRSFAFLFDMNELFEAYVGALVKRIESSARLQVERNFGNLKLKPDILIENRLIIDTKYKRVKSRDEISAADKYQMFAYGKNFGVDRVILIYPDFGDGYEDELVLGKGEQSISLKIDKLQIDKVEDIEKILRKIL